MAFWCFLSIAVGSVTPFALASFFNSSFAALWSFSMRAPNCFT
jgi:hypothetical protein